MSVLLPLLGYRNVRRQAGSNRHIAYLPLNALLAVDTEAPLIGGLYHCALGSSLPCSTSAVLSCSSRCLHFSWSGVIDTAGNLATMSLQVLARNSTDTGFPFVTLVVAPLLLFSSQPSGSFASCDSVLAPGAAVRAVLTATDLAGNVASVSTSTDLVVDGTPP